VSGLTHEELVTLIVGHRLGEATSPDRRGPGRPVLRVERLGGLTTDFVSFELKAGEVVGIAGIEGSGREELANLLTGAVAPRAGRIELTLGEKARLVSPYGPREALTAGIVLVARDREAHSTIPNLVVRENLTLPRLDTRRRTWLDIRRERLTTRTWLTRLGVRPPEPERVLATLSGGNQQKVVLAKALRCRPIVLVLDEPVQGVDVEAKAAIFDQILSAASAGQAVVIASSEAEDLASICDRVLVMRGGRVRQELTKEMLSVSRIVQACIAVDEDRIAA
jgi:ribose transport system ATP-binding protein